jgi:hypothetical protein
MKTWEEFLQTKIDENNWISKAINPAHKGFCSPTTKKMCTPRRKALALRFKSGDLHKKKKKKKD